MKNSKIYIIFFLIIFCCYLTVLSQEKVLSTPRDGGVITKPYPPPDTNVIYIDYNDYVLRVKIIEECTCYGMETNFIKLDKNISISANAVARFLKMEVIERTQDFTVDSISDSIILNIKYLLVPEYMVYHKKIPFDKPINILVNRGFSYDYLDFVYIVDDSTKFERRDPSSFAIDSLKNPKIGTASKFLYRLFWWKIISYNTLLKLSPKSKNSKNIERCLKELKKKDKLDDNK
ncbi:MAG: hypothetical protein LBM25_01555 [Bacteroidales bacterium]|jgi:hypothetical protein|nr:hypothetical protein [Bacteroidales bacterium]